MKTIKNILSQMHTWILWAMLSVLFWGWIFTFLTDTSPKKKVIVYVDAPKINAHELDLKLEENLPEGIKMIRVLSIDYHMIETTEDGDIFLLRESTLNQMLVEAPDTVATISIPAGEIGFESQGKCFGLRVYDPNASPEPSENDPIWFFYPYEAEKEAVYLCFSSKSIHLSENPGAIDNAAWEVAGNLIDLIRY
jgi:hypothetical protein